MNNQEKKMRMSEVIKRLFSYSKKYRAQYILALVLGFLAVITELISPLMLSNVVDGLTDSKINLKDIIMYTTIYILVSVLLSELLLLIERIILTRIGQKIVYKIREDIFVNTMNLSHKEFISIPTGKLVTRITSDTLTLNELFTKTMINMIRDILTSAVALIIMVIVSYKLFLYVLLFTPLLIILTFVFQKFSRKMYRNVRNSSTGLNTFISE